MIDRRQFILSSAAVLAAGPALAQAAWPTRQISLVILFAAGSGTDTMARIFAEKLSAQVGQPVVVENKPGANGTIAGNFVAKAPPDGHTLMFTSNTSHAAAAALVKNVPYDQVKDFETVGLIGLVPFVMVAHPGAPFSTLPELVAYAKANPGKLSFGTGNSTGVVAGETLKRLAGIDTLHVPYKSVPPAPRRRRRWSRCRPACCRPRPAGRSAPTASRRRCAPLCRCRCRRRTGSPG